MYFVGCFLNISYNYHIVFTFTLTWEDYFQRNQVKTTSINNINFLERNPNNTKNKNSKTSVFNGIKETALRGVLNYEVRTFYKIEQTNSERETKHAMSTYLTRGLSAYTLLLIGWNQTPPPQKKREKEWRYISSQSRDSTKNINVAFGTTRCSFKIYIWAFKNKIFCDVIFTATELNYARVSIHSLKCVFIQKLRINYLFWVWILQGYHWTTQSRLTSFSYSSSSLVESGVCPLKLGRNVLLSRSSCW